MKFPESGMRTGGLRYAADSGAIARAIAPDYTAGMAASDPVPTPDPAPADPASRLVALLETLPPPQRQELTTWLLGRPNLGIELLSAHPRRLRQAELAVSLPPHEDHQLITIRLPAERHAHLRTWCAEHGFTMAAVVRGLVERFLEQRGASPSPPGAEVGDAPAGP